MATTQQTALDEIESQNPTTAFLSDDEAVDQLSDFEVKDVYGRGQFIHLMIDAHDRERRLGNSWMGTEDCERVQELLSEGSGSAIIEAAIQGLGRKHDFVGSLGWENGPGNAETLFHKFGPNGSSEEERVENARKQIKTALGGCGMPRINVMRSRVNYHNEISEEDD